MILPSRLPLTASAVAWTFGAGESLEGLEVGREDNDNVDDYALKLTQTKGANPNYSITFVDGTFTINQRLLTVTWGTTEFTYDGEEHCPQADLGNVVYVPAARPLSSVAPSGTA